MGKTNPTEMPQSPKCGQNNTKTAQKDAKIIPKWRRKLKNGPKHPKIIPIFLVNTLGDSDRIPSSSLYPPSSLQETQVGGCHGPHYSFIICFCAKITLQARGVFSSDFVFSVPSFIENNNKRKKRVASFWLRWRFSYLCTGQGSDWKIIFLACFLCMKYA